MVDARARAVLSDGVTSVMGVVLTDAVAEARRRHETSAIATVALGRAMVAGTLLGSTMRDTGSVNLQFVGNGPLGSLVVDASGGGNVRAYVRRPLITMPIPGTGRVSTGAAVGREGHLHVLLNPAAGSAYSRGTCSFVSGEIDDDVAGYLERSAQVASAIGTDVILGGERGVMVAGGLLVQALPGSSESRVEHARELLRGPAISNLLSRAPYDAIGLMQRLFPDEQLKILDERPVRWFCRCSRDRVLSAISTLGAKEVTDILTEDGKVDATCDFCRATYALDADDLRALLAEMTAAARGGFEVA